MPQPLDVPADRAKAVTLTTPLHCIEVGLGALVARDRDGRVAAEGKAGETIPGDPLPVPVVLAAREVPTRVKLWYESEAHIYEARRLERGTA